MIEIKKYTALIKDNVTPDSIKSIYKEYRALEMPEAAATILTALIFSFPEAFKNIPVANSFKQIGDLMPVLIACNDYCDIGVPASKHQPISQIQSNQLQILERRLWQGFRKEKAEFCKKHPDQKEKFSDILDNYFHESLILARNRNKQDLFDFISLDSLLVEEVCMEILIPEVSKAINIDSSIKVETYQDLYAKYEPFLRTRERIDELNELERKFMILHVTEIILQLSDDKIGKDIDILLNAPSFYLSKDEDGENYDNKKIRELYLEVLKKLDGSSLIANFADVLFTVAQKIRFSFKYGIKSYPIYELTELSNMLRGSRKDLREKLMESSLLPDLFRTSNYEK